MQLISKKEAIRLCFEQKDSSYMESEVQKLDDMLDELEHTEPDRPADMAEDSEEPEEVVDAGEEEIIAYNRQVLNTLHNLQETQEGILEAMAKMKEQQEVSE